MADNAAGNQQDQQQEGQGGQERAEAHETDQQGEDQQQGGDSTGAQEPNTERDDLAAPTMGSATTPHWPMPQLGRDTERTLGG